MFSFPYLEKKVGINVFASICILFSVLPLPTSSTRDQLSVADSSKVAFLDFRDNEGDDRLSANIQIQKDAVSLSDIIADIAKETGISLSVEGNSIRNISTSVYTGQMPIYRVLRCLARLHTLSWRISGGNNSSGKERKYVLYESAANRQYRERLNRRSESIFFSRMDKVRRYAALTAEQRARMAAEGDSYAAFLEESKAHLAGTELLAAFPDSTMDNLLTKRENIISSDQLSEVGQNALVNLIAELNKVRPTTNQLPSPHDKIYTLRYKVSGSGSDVNPVLYVSNEGTMFMAPSPYETGGGSKLWLQGLQQQSHLDVLPTNRAEGRKLNKFFLLKTGRWFDVLKAMSEQLHLNVFSDAYNKFPNVEFRPVTSSLSQEKGVTLSELLDGTGYWERVWWQENKSGDDVLFLKRDWYLYRHDDSVEALMQYLVNKKGQDKSLTLEDWAQIATLPETELPRVENALGIDTESIMLENRMILLLYGYLTPLQRMEAMQGGVEVSSFAPAARTALQNLIQTLNLPRLSAAQSAATTLQILVNKSGTTFSFRREPSGKKALSGKDWHVPELPEAKAKKENP